ncbi:MAG: aminopeptidase P family protein [bacterium]
MFNSEVYAKRRNELKEILKSGVVLLPGNNASPMNYPANTYKFRQDSTFLYYFGLDFEGLFGIIDIDNNEEVLFGTDLTLDDLVWTGPELTLEQKAELSGINKILPTEKLNKYVTTLFKDGSIFHYLPQYRTENIIYLSELLTLNYDLINKHASKEFILAAIKQRSIKSDLEVLEIEKAIEISYDMYDYAFKNTKPGISERDVYSFVEAKTYAKGHGPSFASIFSVNGERLHNPFHENIMQAGQLVLLDSGAESLEHYASDITRTFPVNGKFTEFQKDIYSIVLNTNETAIKTIKAGRPYRDVHFDSARTIVDGLKAIGLMKGDTAEAVKLGAHAMFYPHGLGHMLGLDVHDMEALGESLVGYTEDVERSQQFGLKYLRMARPLEVGFVMTVEPGIYFIPQLIKTWKKEKKFVDFINYAEAEKHFDFGGIRIEDDILVTNNGARVLGKPIPKSIKDIEDICS